MRNATWRCNKCGPEAGTSPPLGRDREWVGIRWGVSWMALRTPSYSEFCQCADRASVLPLPLVPAVRRSPTVECDWCGGLVPVGWCSSCPSLSLHRGGQSKKHLSRKLLRWWQQLVSDSLAVSPCLKAVLVWPVLPFTSPPFRVIFLTSVYFHLSSF